MSRKKNKHKRPSAAPSAPSTTAQPSFSEQEEAFFDADPAAMGESPSSSPTSSEAREQRRRAMQEEPEVAYDSSLFDASAGDEDEDEEGFEDEEGLEGDTSALDQMPEDAGPLSLASDGPAAGIGDLEPGHLPEDWMGAATDEPMPALSGDGLDAYASSVRDDLHRDDKFDPYGGHWEGGGFGESGEANFQAEWDHRPRDLDPGPELVVASADGLVSEAVLEEEALVEGAESPEGEPVAEAEDVAEPARPVTEEPPETPAVAELTPEPADLAEIAVDEPDTGVEAPAPQAEAPEFAGDEALASEPEGEPPVAEPVQDEGVGEESAEAELSLPDAEPGEEPMAVSAPLEEGLNDPSELAPDEIAPEEIPSEEVDSSNPSDGPLDEELTLEPAESEGGTEGSESEASSEADEVVLEDAELETPAEGDGALADAAPGDDELEPGVLQVEETASEDEGPSIDALSASETLARQALADESTGELAAEIAEGEEPQDVVGIDEIGEAASALHSAGEREEPAAFMTTTGEVQMVTDDELEEARADLAGQGDATELEEASLLESGDPGDLPEPPASDDALKLPSAEVDAGLGWDFSLAPAEELPPAPESLPDTAPAAEPPPPPKQPRAPLWELPQLSPVSSEVLESSPVEAPGTSEPEPDLASRFEGQAQATPEADAEVTLESLFLESQQLLRDEALLVDGDQRAMYLLEAGRLLLGRGMQDQAREAMQESLNAREAFAPALRALSQQARADGRWTELVDYLETQALAAGSDGARAAAQLFSAEIRAEKLDQVGPALGDLREALEAMPDDLYMLSLQEAWLRGDQRWEEVLKIREHMALRLPPAAQVTLYTGMGELAMHELRDGALARRWFAAALDLDPAHPPAAMAMEALLKDTGDLAALSAHYEAEAQRQTGPGAVQAWLRLADVAARRGEPLEAMEALQQALTRDPHNPLLRREYQGWLARTGDWEVYVETIQEELSRVAGDEAQALLHLALAQIYEHALGRKAEALEATRAALGARPEWRLAQHEVLRLLEEEQDWLELARQLQEAGERESSPELSGAFYYQAGMQLETHDGDRTEVRHCFEEALKRDPSQPVYAWTLRRLLEDEQAWDELAQRMVTGLAPWPFVGTTSVLVGELELRGAVAELAEQNPSAAYVFYRQAFEAGARSPLALGGMLRYLRRTGQWEPLASLHGRLTEEVDDPGLKQLLQWEHSRLLVERLGRPEEASTLRQALLETGTFLPVLWEELRRRQQAGDLEGYRALRTRETELVGEPADAHLEALGEAMYWARRGQPGPFEALAADPGDALALDLHEWWLQESGNAEALSRLYATRLERLLDTRHTRYLQLRRAAWLEQVGELDEALVLLAGAVQEGATDEVTLNRLEQVSSALGQARSLHDLLGRSVASHVPTQVGVVLRAARNLENRLGDLPGALEEYRRALKLEPTNVEALEGLIRTGESQRNALALGEGLAARASVLQPADQPGAWLRAGRALLEAGEEARAEQAFLQAMEGELVRDQAFAALGDLYRSRGNVEGLERLYAPLIKAESDQTLHQCWVMELADHLEALGAIGPALARFERLATQESCLPACLRMELLHVGSEDWGSYVTALQARAGAVIDRNAQGAAMERAIHIRATRLQDPWAHEQLLHRTLVKDPGSDSALDAYRSLLASQGRWTDLVVALEALVTHARDDDQRVRRMLDVAWIYAHRLDDLDAAIERYLDVLDIREGELEAIGAIKAICLKRQDWNRMVATLAREALALDEEGKVKAYLEIAGLWDQKLNDPGTAVASYQKVLEMRPDDRQALAALTALYRRLELWDPFVEVCERWINVRRDEDPALLNELGATLARIDRLDQAVPVLLRALTRGHPDIPTMRRVAERYEARGAWQEAAELFQRVAEVTPHVLEQVELWQRVASISRDHLQDLGMAISALERLLENVPNHLAVMWTQAQQLEQAGRPGDALTMLDQLVALPDAPAFIEAFADPERLAFHRQFARLLEGAGIKEQAAAHYEAALRLAPRDRSLLERLSGLYLSLERWDRHAAMLQALIDTEPSLERETLAERYYALGQAWQAAGRAEPALDAYNQVKDLEPRRVEVYIRLAEVYFTQEAWNALLGVYNNVIKYSSEVELVVDAYVRKADILADHMAVGDPTYLPKAVMHFEKALQYDRRNTYSMLRLAELALMQRQYPRAAEWLKRVLAVDPTSIQTAQTHLLGGILCAVAQKDPGTALANFRKAASVSSLVEAHLPRLEEAVQGADIGNLLEHYRTILPARLPLPGVKKEE